MARKQHVKRRPCNITLPPDLEHEITFIAEEFGSFSSFVEWATRAYTNARLTQDRELSQAEYRVKLLQARELEDEAERQRLTQRLHLIRKQKESAEAEFEREHDRRERQAELKQARARDVMTPSLANEEGARYLHLKHGIPLEECLEAARETREAISRARRERGQTQLPDEEIIPYISKPGGDAGG